MPVETRFQQTTPDYMAARARFERQKAPGGEGGGTLARQNRLESVSLGSPVPVRTPWFPGFLGPRKEGNSEEARGRRHKECERARLVLPVWSPARTRFERRF